MMRHLDKNPSVNLLSPKNEKTQSSENLQISFCKILKQVSPCKSTAKEVSFEWSHHRISSTDSKDRTTLHVSVIDSSYHLAV